MVNLLNELKSRPIAVIGLGYVGLPLAIALGKKYQVTGFDVNAGRVDELSAGEDSTLEADADDLRAVTLPAANNFNGVYFTNDETRLQHCTIFIITVPTPVDHNNNPDLTPLLRASEIAGRVLKQDDIVIYESTVYPGCTEETCVPVLENFSGLVYNTGFYCGYSPERINPGDKTRRLPDIVKVTSGSTPQAAVLIDQLYQTIIPAGTHLAPSIKVAEAAKVIENAQRDINIAFVNELSKIFSLLNIDTTDVLAAAATKWNFLNFKPGLVGGHCIGVDPYYLAQKAKSVGYYPEIILSGRRINDGMGAYIADAVIKLMIKKKISVWESEILVLGITFKENCPDVRNTKVVDIVKELQLYQADITVYDPLADCDRVKHEYGISCLSNLPADKMYNAVIIAVSHQEFYHLNFDALVKSPGVLYDVKGILEAGRVDGRL